MDGVPNLKGDGTPPYTLSKLGRPVAKQLVADEKRARWRRINAALVWIAITVLAGLFTLGFNVLDRRIQRWEQNAATSQQSN